MLRYALLLLFTFVFTPLLALEDDGPLGSIPLSARRLVSDADHTEFLKHTLRTAEEKVMISSYNVSPKRLLIEGIGQEIIHAAARGVSVYIYYQNRPYYSEEDYADLSMIAEHCTKFEENANHSKCVVKDKSTVAIGSYNWLGNTREGSFNASMVMRGMLSSGLIHDVWQGIRFYQSVKYGNIKGVKSFFRSVDAFSTGEYQFAPGQFFYTLRTPDAHQLFLDDVWQKARKRVLLFSPFIRLEKLQNTFTTSLLQDLQHRGVTLHLITSPSPCTRTPWEKGKIFTFLNNLRSTQANFSYKTQPNLHAKTLIADDDWICEGSFNWLSAVSDIDHEANNFEMSVSVRGDIARQMIQAFQDTTFGRSVLPAQPQRIASSLDSKRSRAEQSPAESRSSQVAVSSTEESPFEIFSGIPYGKKGYSVRFKGDSLRDENRRILYFETLAKAREAGQAFLAHSQTREESGLGEREAKSLCIGLDETAKRHLEEPIVASCSSNSSTSSESHEDIFTQEDLDAFALIENDYYSSQSATSSQQTSSPELFDKGLLWSELEETAARHFETPRVASTLPAQGSSSSTSSTPITFPSSFNRDVQIFSGERFGRKGYCARLKGNYLKDNRNQTIYFATSEIAKQTAYATWKQ